jgi:hypothetical protein
VNVEATRISTMPWRSRIVAWPVIDPRERKPDAALSEPVLLAKQPQNASRRAKRQKKAPRVPGLQGAI